jgi:mannose-6-phosphate isomerase-like protein (cupin superfamily)
MIISNRNITDVYQTKDGSQISELMHPGVQGNVKQSLAEAVVSPGQKTVLHKHVSTEEIYYILEGRGYVNVGDEVKEVSAGDVILIPPGSHHNIENKADQDLRFLCCCSPAYSHDDTVLIED